MSAILNDCVRMCVRACIWKSEGGKTMPACRRVIIKIEKTQI